MQYVMVFSILKQFFFLFVASGHGVPTLHWGVDCELSETPFINKCNVDGVYQVCSIIV